MKIINKIIDIKTKKELEFIDITDKIIDFIKNSQITKGIVNIQSLHTTASLLVNENEPLLLEDFKNHLKKFAPRNFPYNHNDFTRRTVNMCEGECKNGHSHIRGIHLPTSVTLNIIKGALSLGTWQRVFFVEQDHDRRRKVELQIIGQ